MNTAGYTSKYSSYRKYITSSEVAYDSSQRRSTYSSSVADEYSSSRGVSSSRKEIISGTDTHSLPVYIATQDYQPEATNKDGLALEEGQIVEVLDNKNTSSWLVRTKARPPKIGWAPGTIFEVPTEYYRLKRHSRELSPTDKPLTKIEEALLKRNAVFQDLMKSEETFVSELHHLLQTYLHFLDCQSPPPSVRQLKDQLSLNLREIYNFHANVLLKGFQYYSNDPGIVGQTFMRLERDFDHHVKYCHDEPETEKLLEDPVVREYFEKAKEQIETSEKTLLDYLRLPIKRILDYQQALKEMIRYSITANVPTDSLQRALELMLWIPKRASDLNLIHNILDLPTETAKLGRLLRHEQFEVWQDSLDRPKGQLHVFLFKTKIVATEKVEPEDPDEVPEFKHVFTVRLDKYDIREYLGNSNIVQLVPVDASLPTYFFKATAPDNAEIVKQAWIKDVQENIETTGELPESEVEVQGDFIDFSDIKSEFSEYSNGRDDESPPAKKPKTPPAISRSTSAQSVYMTQTGSIEMEGSSVTRTQYGFRTVHETTAKMSLKVTGNPMPVITWYKDGVLLQEDERKKFYSDDDGYFALTIEPVQVEDTGRYTCVATNEYGQARTSAFFRVVRVDREPEQPKFLKVMRDLELHEGDTATFTCEVEGWPEPEIQFYLDGQPIHISREHNIEYDGRTVRLTVREVQPEDGGSYVLKAVNGSGEVQCAATLTVIKDLEKNKMPPYFQQQLNDVVVVEDQSVKFKTVCSGDPTPEVVWYINGVQLTNSDKVHMIAEDGVYILTIDNITQHFDGELTCCAFNRLGEISCCCRITVNKADYPPSFEQELRDQVVTAGEAVKLQVVISAQPEATVSWWFNDEQISEYHPSVRLSAKPQAGIYSIEITKATTDMCGVIKCQASNYLGTVFSSANLSVEEAKSAPAFRNMLQDIVALPREYLKIHVSTTGYPRPTVAWKLNGEEIKESPNVKISSSGNDYYLEILSFTENDAGELECTAVNSLGIASSKCQVSTSPAKMKSNFEKDLPKSTTAEEGKPISFSVQSKQSATFSWFLNGRELHDSDSGIRIMAIGDQESRLIIESFSESLSGRLTCTATSPLGVSETSTDIKSTLGMKEGAGPLPPIVLAEYGGRVLLKVTIESDQAEVCWRLNGEPLKNSEKVHVGRKGADFFLEIEDIDDSASGELLCEVRQGTRSDTFGTTVKVERRALTTLLDGLKDTTVRVGDTVQFNLSLKDAKKYEVKWFLNDHELVESEKVHINVYPEQAECCLKIESITEEFNGELKCNIMTPSGDYVSSAQLHVVPRAAPVVVKGLSDSFVQAGDTVKFSVFAENAVEGKVKWVLNGSELLPSDSVIIATEQQNECSLTLKNINPQQSGVLECLISTPYGVSRSSAKLTVKPLPEKLMKPEFRAIMAPVVIYEGDTLETRVVLEGEPQPEVKWYINDVPLVEDSNVEITTEKGISKVEIKKVNFDLNGVLKCVAKNEYGEVATSTSVSIRRQIPVEFEQFLCDTTCREGDTLKLKAVLLGQPRPEVSWYLKGKKLVQTDKIHIYTEQNTYVAIISDITCDYSGEVLCKAVNEFGEASSSAMLTVLPRGVPPDFLEWMNSISAVDGAEVVHHVKFTGEPTPTIRWFINNQEVHNSDNFAIHTDKDVCTLTIKHFSASLVGEIICKAENDAGEVSCTSQMSLAPAGYIREEVSERSELEAVALSTGEIEGSEAGTDFAVSLPDEDMEEETSRLESSVLAPKFITKIKDTRVTVGKQAVFECIVPGTKGVCVKWLKDNKEIELLARIRVGSHKEENLIIHRLTVDDVTKADAGTYTCVVMNEHGQEICSARLEVDEQWTVAQLPETVPEIVEVLHSCVVEENEEAIMHCTVTGCPDAQVRWYKDNVQLESSKRHQMVSEAEGVFVLKIPNVTMKDAGEYKCEVFNASGVASSTATLTVTVPTAKEPTVGEAMAPKFVEPLMVSEDAHKKVTMFTCKIYGQPRPQVRWFKNEKMLNSSYKYEIINEEQDSYVLKIHDTTTEDNGEYRCEAFNENGIASNVFSCRFPLVEQVTESTLPESAPEFSKPLKSAVLNKGEALHLECTVVGQPAPSIQWFKSEEELKTTETVTITSLPNGVECLDMKETMPSDSGDYRCIATNRLGYSSSEATVAVHAPEEMETAELLESTTEFVESLHNQTVKENETGILSCRVTGPPVTSVQWFKEDVLLESSEKYEIISEANGVFALQVHDSTAEDSGEFKCEVTTEKGSSISKAYLTVEKSSVKEEFAEEQPPEILKSLTPTSLREGESLTLECTVTGKPRPTVQWFRNGEEIEVDESVKLETSSGGVCRLTVHNVTQKDAGEYRCIATNTCGASWSDASVTVNVAEQAVPTSLTEAAPLFVRQLQSCTVKANEQHILQCRVTGAPKPQVRWLKNGVELEPSAKYEIVCEDGETHILKVQNFNKDDSAVYRCEASNEKGFAASEANIEIQRAEVATAVPTFSETLVSTSVVEGEPLLLECTVSGEQDSIVEWFKNGQKIEATQNVKIESLAGGVQHLEVRNIALSDSGVYRCVVANQLGDSSTEARVTVQTHETVEEAELCEAVPVFIEVLKSQVAKENEVASLSCKVYGLPTAEVQWFKDGVELKSSEKYELISEVSGVFLLQVHNIGKQDAGEYTCVATNKMGSVSSNAFLTVSVAEERVSASQQMAPAFLSAITEAFPMCGEKVHLECVVTAAETEGDFKLYGTVPQFVETLHNCDVQENETAVMKCKVIGTPLPEVRWFKENASLESSAKFELTSDVDGLFLLKIHNAKEEDVGEYRCEVFNCKGVASSKAQLSVTVGETSEAVKALEAPLFVKTLTSCSLTEGEHLQLNCAVSGQPTPTIQWFKNGEEIKATGLVKIESLPEGILTLVVQNAHVGDSGMYRCLATNEAGECSTEATVSVQGKYFPSIIQFFPLNTACETMELEELAETAPEFVQVLHFCDVAETQEGILSCKLTGFPKPQVRWFKDGVPIQPSEKYEMVTDDNGLVLLKVHVAGREDSGEYRCEAFNSRGVAWTEAPLNVKAAELMEYEEGEEVAPDFLEPVQACVVNKGEDAVLICRISGVPTPQVCWYKNGVPLVPDERVEITSFGDRHTLVVHNAQQEDVADYRCEAKNDAGVVWSDATVSGNPTPEVHWYRDGKLLDLSKDVEIASTSDGTVTLVIQHAKVEDQGNYRCEAVNILGSACSKAPLSVFPTEEIMEVEESASMQFIEPLHHYMREEDTVAVFECKLKAQPVSTIVWYKDGAPILPDNFTVIESLPDGLQRLTLRCTTASAVGHYACLAKSDITEVKTEDDLLSISKVPLALEFLQGLKRQCVKKGDTVTMRCQVNMKGRSKLPTVKWYKSGRELLPDKRVKMEATMDGWFTLTVSKFEENDAGMYTCIITENSSVIKSEAPVELTVTEAGGEFTIVKELASQTISAGEKLELELVTSESWDDIRWLHNNEVVLNDKRTKIEQPEACVCRLTVAETSPKDQGNYFVIATKGNKTVESQAKVIVTEGKHLEITKALEDITVPAGAEVTLEVQFNEPIDHAQWYLDSKELVSDAKVSLEQLDERILRLHLKNADKNDAGVYGVVAHSGEQTTECKANLSVQAQQFLTITKGLDDVLVEPHKPLTLTVNVDGLPEKVEWLKDGEPLKEQANLKIEVPANGVYRLAISDTLPDSAGLYTFRAIDETGVIESSGTLSLMDMAEELPQKRITKLEMVEGLMDQAVAEREPVCLRIKLNKKPKVVKWYKNGKEIIPSNRFKAEVDETGASLEISSLLAEDSGLYEVVASDERDSVASSGKLLVTSASQLDITRGLQDRTVMKGTELTLEIQLSKPADMATWYHGTEKLANGQNLRLEEIDGRVYRLHVQHADIQDAGEYRVVVKGDGEKAESKANITVKTIPNLRISKELQDVSPTLHETVIMEVLLEGLPDNVEWFKNGSKLSSVPGMRIEVGGDGWHRLILEDVLPDSAGLYKFRASNPDGSVESSGTVILKQPVEEKPGDAEAALTLMKGLEDQTVDLGHPISLSVKLNKRPKDIKWYSNGKEIRPSMKKKIKFDGLEATLEVDKASEDDGGIYEVVVSDENTTIRSSGNVRIAGINCANFDTSRLKDGVKLTNVPNYSFTCTEGLYNLQVKQAEMGNAGEYMFIARKASDAVSSVGSVVVKSPPSEEAVEQPEKLTFVECLEDQQLQEGDELKLKVQTNKKPMTVKWTRNGIPVTSTGGTKLVDNGDRVFELIVENASRGDAGSYKVIIGDEHASAESVADVVVIEKAAEKPLQVLKGMADLTCDIGSKACFEVQISGKPKSYRWYKNGREVKQTPRISLKEMDGGRYCLEIEKTVTDDGGEFSFEAENDVGKVHSQALLTVQSPAARKGPAAEPLVITRPLDDQTAEEGAEISFEAEFNRGPKEVHWYKGMDVVTGNEKVKISSPAVNASKLHVTRVSPEDSSSYRVEAIDDLGNIVTSTARLTVNASPERLEFIKPMADVQVAKGDTATLEVQVKGIPQSVKWYKNGRLLPSQGRQQEIGKGTYILKIPNASDDDQATYKCELENQLGSISTEGTLVVLPSVEEAGEKEIGALKVLKGLADITLYVGDDLLLEVELSSKPEEVLWFNNGHPVLARNCEVEVMPNGHAVCRCRLPNIDISCDGTFTVKARNPYGSADSSNKLTVKGKPPKILTGLEDRRTSPGNRVVFEVEVDRKPKLVKWYKNGRLVKENERTVLISVDDCTYQLVLNDVDKEDVGNYLVEVSNDFGVAKSEAKLTIIEPVDEMWRSSPRIVKGLNDVEIFDGNHATFSVTVEGKPTSVRWYRNGTELTSSQRVLPTQLDGFTYKLTLRECHKDDMGVIKVLAMNDFGSDTSEGRLIVKEVPTGRMPSGMEKAARFIIPLEDVAAEESKKAVLSCKVEGLPTPLIKWFKDGKEIDKNERVTYSMDEDKVCSLSIGAISPEDEGCYAALAKNSLGQDRTECYLTIAAPKGAEELEHGVAPEFIKPLRSKSIIEGEDLTLDNWHIPSSTLQWLRDVFQTPFDSLPQHSNLPGGFVNGKVVEPTERVQGKIECIASEVVFRLVIKSARLSDAANYKCVATNKYGTKESAADITIEVLKPADLVQPKFVIPLSDLHVAEGETLRAEVKIRELGDNRWLFTLKDARPEDSGFYECVATNIMGSDVSQAYFTIKPSGVRREKGADFYPPVFNVPLHDRCLPEKATMTIECYVDANPKAKIQWYKGDLPLDDNAHVQTENYPDGKCRLRINFFSSGDVGYYRCVATNELGSATTSAYLSMEVEKEGEVERRREYAPYFTKTLENVRTCVGKSLALECTVAGVPFPEIRWYKDGMMIFGQEAITELFEDGKCCLKIERISDKDVGAYRCVASNIHGSSSCACTVGTEILKEERREGREPPVILKGLTDLWAEKGDDLEFRCEIAGSQPLEIKWSFLTLLT
ncbi:hypothetical protein M514_00956 [Trichuris suis]|uniref:Immunoglobulin I-set domain protein n=1 Tax=Trichuris suis TaxID=68888 RepID=A0A085NLW0_9BILA|nr:hypothetical protein M514_00956 [Trichuris suis]